MTAHKAMVRLCSKTGESVVAVSQGRSSANATGGGRGGKGGRGERGEGRGGEGRIVDQGLM